MQIWRANMTRGRWKSSRGDHSHIILMCRWSPSLDKKLWVPQTPIYETNCTRFAFYLVDCHWLPEYWIAIGNFQERRENWRTFAHIACTKSRNLHGSRTSKLISSKYQNIIDVSPRGAYVGIISFCRKLVEQVYNINWLFPYTNDCLNCNKHPQMINDVLSRHACSVCLLLMATFRVILACYVHNDI